MSDGTGPALARRGVAPSGDAIAQAKLTVGAAGDRFEREADRVAQAVSAGHDTAVGTPPPVISGLTAQRAALPVQPGPERDDDEASAPEQRVQRAAEPAAGPAGGTASEAVSGHVEQARSRPASRLDPGTRARMEQALGADLGAVRVHTDAAAGRAAGALNAQAFTVGQDVFFAPGRYNPSSGEGRRLLAHELTHTVQQGGGSARARRIQRSSQTERQSSIAPDEEVRPPATTTTRLDGGEGAEAWSVEVGGEQSAGTIRVPELELPELDGVLKGSTGVAISGSPPQEGRPFVRPPATARASRETSAAYEKWNAEVREKHASAVESALETRLEQQGDAAPITDPAGRKLYVLKRGSVLARNSEFLVAGTPAELARHDVVIRPMIKRDSGAHRKVDADHILEDQLGGKDDASNLWLLDRGYNRSIGPQINSRVESTLNDVLGKARAEKTRLRDEDNVHFEGALPAGATAAKRRWTIEFATVSAGTFSGSPRTWWTYDDVKAGTHLEHYRALEERELVAQGFRFDEDQPVLPTHINVFPQPDGGRAVRFKVARGGDSLRKPGYFLQGVEVVDVVRFEPPSAERIGHELAVLKVRYTKRASRGKNAPLVWAQDEISVQHEPRLGFGGYVTRESIRATFSEAEFQPLSPVRFPDVHLSGDGELVAGGEISSTKLLLPGLRIPIRLQGTDILIDFPIGAEALSLGPVTVTDAALALGYGADGFFIQGSAGILVPHVGSGTLVARAQRDDVVLAGDFDLDLSFLDPVKIEATYSLRDDDFTAKATLGVGPDALPGVESGEVVVEIARSGVSVDGTLALGGVLAGSTLTVAYTPEGELLIEGKDLPLPVERLPGVTGATATVRARRDPDSGLWVVGGGGTAMLEAPGATGLLEVLVDGPAVTFRGRADVAKGPASGWLAITVTNREVDEEGNPVEGPPTSQLRIWGSGEATVVFGDVLCGTVGIEYTPDGRVILSGEVALPPTFPVFERKPYDKTLLEVSPPDFPIWGVKLGPVGFGIFAFVDAEIRLSAFVGPGELRDTALRATFELDKPEDAQVEGGATFFVPAYAGLTLDVGGGLKAQAAVAYVKGRVGLDGTLGLGVDTSIGVDVAWNRDDGLELEAEADVTARPKFEVGVNAAISAGVDLGLTDIEKTWGPWRETLGEFGPQMELGVTFPVRWSEKDGLQLSLDDVDIKQPRLDAKAMMKDAFDTLV